MEQQKILLTQTLADSEELKLKINQIVAEQQQERRQELMEQFEKAVEDRTGLDKLLVQFNSIHPGFASELLRNYPKLTQADMQFCILYRMNLSTKEISTLLHVEPRSIYAKKYRIMEKMGLISILGSSRDGRKASRGIDIGSFKRIFEGLKKGYSLNITPDGPRGPNQKINGEIVNIARIAQVGILAASCSASKFKQLNTWDKFKIPLPFSTLCFYMDERPFYVEKTADKEEMEKIKINIEQRLDILQEKSLEIARGQGL